MAKSQNTITNEPRPKHSFIRNSDVSHFSEIKEFEYSEFSNAVPVFDKNLGNTIGFNELEDVVPVEFNQFYDFEHEGKKYCINSLEEIFDNNQFMEHRWEFVRDIIKDMINKQSTHLI